MKKVYALVGILLGFGANAQQMSTFEDLTLAPETYFDGSDLSGTPLATEYYPVFNTGSVQLNNTWNSEWGYWSNGWIYSNTTDATTSGSANISSAITGVGNNSSANYAIGKGGSYMVIDTSITADTLNGLYVTNTTYAHNSMRDGDTFAKKFTNVDSDWFLLTAHKIENGASVASIDLYLADFTHADSSMDYILNTWTYLDLSSFGYADSIQLELTSSDTGTYGMNTPNYFAIDDVEVGMNTNDFEDLTLANETFFDGSDLSGKPDDPNYLTIFESGDAEFFNTWHSTWFYWSAGWIYSNTTDVTTAGSANLSSAYAGGGANNSTNYGVGKNNAFLFLDTTEYTDPVNGVYITNTTYAGISMRDGDNFGKKFTNADQDWFMLTIRGIKGDTISNDSINFYLADFTHADSTQDYIVDSWEYVDLTPLGTVEGLVFELSSSDVGLYGMNTPAFFAIDNLGSNGVGIEENNLNVISVYPNPANDRIFLNTNVFETFEIYNVNGKLVQTINAHPGENAISLNNLANGMYIIKSNQKMGRFIKK